MYDPPSKTNWFYTGSFDQECADAYNEGYGAARKGIKEEENPHKASGHERDTTWSDEFRYWWYVGWNNYFEQDKES